MKIFCGYRSWAESLFYEIVPLTEELIICKGPEELKERCKQTDGNIVVLAGWSWYVDKDILEKNTVVGLHPSDLPHYAGGSPIQNQILDGITETKMTLFELNEEYDKGQIIDKCDLSLRGGMIDIFNSLTDAGKVLLLRFFEKYPDYSKNNQEGKGNTVRRLKPSDSELTHEKLKSMSALDLYNFMRCREDPYPNVYVEDETGKLLIKKVDFVSNEDSVNN